MVGSSKRLVVFILILAAAGCVSGNQGRSPAAAAGASDPGLADRIGMLESRIIGLTDELDRLAGRVVSLERNESGESPVSSRPPVEPPRPEPDPVPPPREPEPRPEPQPEAAPVAPERNLDDWPTPAAGRGRPTAILIDARELVSGSLPSTSHGLWRIMGPSGETLLTQDDVDPEVLSSRPVFWVAPQGALLGPAALPLLGNRPLKLAVSGAVLAHGEAILTLTADAAAALEKTEGYMDLVKAGSLAILLKER